MAILLIRPANCSVWVKLDSIHHNFQAKRVINILFEEKFTHFQYSFCILICRFSSSFLSHSLYFWFHCCFFFCLNFKNNPVFCDLNLHFCKCWRIAVANSLNRIKVSHQIDLSEICLFKCGHVFKWTNKKTTTSAYKYKASVCWMTWSH